jgi:transcriptional regulator with XRE-family HTH domain
MTEKVFLAKVGKRIKELRDEKRISQQELAAMLDYEKSNMSRLESGTTNPRVGTLYRVAKALKVPLSELLDID